MATTLLLTDALADELCEAVAAGVPLATAAQAAGIGASTLYAWVDAAARGEWHPGQPLDPESLARLARFSDGLKRARGTWEAEQVRSIREDAARVNSKTGQRDWRARAWLLNNHPATRQTYRQEHQLQVEQHTTITLERQDIDRVLEGSCSDAERLERLAVYEAALPPPRG